MKKTKIIALVMVISIMVMGAGYAAWTQDLTINTTINTADFDVRFALIGDGIDYESTHVTGTAELHDSDHLATINLNNLYPGAHIRGRLKILNDSSIPVKLGDIVTGYSGNWKGDSDVINVNPQIAFYESDGTQIPFNHGDTANMFTQKSRFENVELPADGYAELTLRFDAGDVKPDDVYKLDVIATFKQFNN